MQASLDFWSIAEESLKKCESNFCTSCIPLTFCMCLLIKVLWFKMHDLLNKPNNTSNLLSYLSKQYLSMHLHWWLLCPPRKFLWNAIYQKLDNKSICLYNVCIVDCSKFLWQIKILHKQKTFEWNKEWVGLFLLCSTSYPCGKMILIILLWTRY